MVLRLKSLELQGFKTFATRTLFEFADGITAIVGPNGSGKSNVADAVRWVLGEQSFGLLRARRTEDVIFSGSEGRPRAGMASGSITFDNSEGWLPIDFSEVNITRRAYRDGQNEYLLNGQKVRLRDIAELLSGAGLAERTYTIIGQGLVDAALGLRAEDRRRLFEEAAGIGLYRQRREEALRRLDSTQRNMDRVKDILAELEPRLRSLERQAQRAQEYRQIQADLRLVLGEWYGYHWHRAQAELRAAKRFARQQEERLNRLREAHSELEQRIRQAKADVHQTRGQLGLWHTESAELHQQWEDLSRQLAVKEERERSLKERRMQLEAELARMEAEVQLQQERVKTAQQNLETLKVDRDQAQAMLAEALQVLDKRQREYQERETTLHTLRKEERQAATRRHQILALMQAVEGQLLRLKEQLNEGQKSESETSEEVNALEEALKRQHALEEARASADAAQENVRSQERVVEEHQVQLAQQDAKIVALQAEVSRLEARLEVLQQAEENLEGYSESARRMLEMLRRQHGGEGVGALSAQLKVPKQVEMAIAAALGLFLEAVVYPAEADLEDALAIVEQASGRVPVLPLGELAAGRKMIPPEDADCLGVAADLVDCPSVLRPAVDLLLGRALVVKDRSAAQRLRWYADTTLTVTLHGEVFDRRGPVIAGGMGPGNPLSRSQERRRLAKKLSAARDQLSQARQQKTQAEQELETLLQSLETAQAAWAQAQERLAQAEEEHRTLAQQLERARQRLVWKREQMEELEAERAEKSTAHSQYQMEVDELDAALEQLRAAIREEKQCLGSVNLQEFQDRVTQWEMRAAVARKAVEEAESRLGEYQQAKSAAEEWKQGLEHQMGELDAELSSLVEGRAELRDQVVALGARIEGLQNKIHPMKQQLAEMEENLEKLYTEEEQARQRLTIGERHYTQAVSALTRKKEGLDNLRERVMDDFGLVAFEYAEEISGPRPLPLKGMVEKLPRVKVLSQDLEKTLKRKRAQLRRMGSIYPDAEQEYEEVRQRYEFLTGQLADLEEAEADVRAVITELDDLMQREFRATFDEVARHFSETFTRLFGGGAARLLLTDPEDLTQTGVDIETRLPGKRPQRLALLSGGERSLTAAALIFSLLKVSPTPFCVLDEVDAMLDEFNLERFRELLEELSQETQFIVITHNRNTVRAADVIYGVSMGRDSTSQVISLRMGEVAEKAGI